MTLEKRNSTPHALVDVGLVEYPRITSLQVKVNRMFGRVHIVIVGDLDSSTAPVLRQKLEDEVLPDPGDEVVLDIGLVSFINSAGLNLLLSLNSELIIQGSKLVIYSPPPMAQRLFDITRLSEVLAIEK